MSGPTLDEEAIFKVACGIESEEVRQDYLEQVCGENTALMDRVVVLLRAHDEAPSFLESPPAGVAATVDLAVAERVGSTIGPYKLREQLGEGGMGIVFVAEQEHPVRRKVALKIIKPGMDTREVIARFEAEEQALALMDHPNIAHVLDAGATETGRPYFVMELVPGVPVTEYCNQQKLPTSARLQLFVQICQAMQHAHQKGIIHRDIKPSNVLITLHDGVPVPKVIDFGVAKAINQRLTERTVYTQASQLVGTPLYMSPEQAELSGLNVDTRTDIYSLGVLLYELLTGTTPFAQQQLSEASYDEMRRIIREEEPPRPSHRISTLNAQALSSVVSQRGDDPRHLSQTLRGELDWIVMTALEKDRTRRYDSASAFAADVERYLADEAVEACPPSTVYRLKKFARRNRMLLTTIAVVALALLVGTGVSLWQAIEARRAGDLAAANLVLAQQNQAEAQAAATREKAQRERAEENFRQARAAVDTYLTKVSEDQLLNAPSLQPLRKDLLQLALSYYQEFIQQQPDDPDLQAELADAHERVGKITGEIGSSHDALKAQQTALEIREKLVKRNPNVLQYQIDLAASYHNVGLVQAKLGHNDHALAFYRMAIAINETVLEQESVEGVEYQSRLATSYNNLALVHNNLGQTGEALALHEKAITIREKLVDQNPDNLGYQSGFTQSYNNLASIRHSLGQLSEAVVLHEKAITIREKLAHQNPDNLGYQSGLAASYNNLALVQTKLRHEDAALAYFQKAITIEERLVDQNPEVLQYQVQLAATYHNLAWCCQPDEPLVILRKAVEIRQKLADENPQVVEFQMGLASSYNQLAGIHKSEGRTNESLESYRKAIAIRDRIARQYPDMLGYQFPTGYNNLAGLLRLTGQPDQAMAWYVKGIHILQKLTQQAPDNIRFQSGLALYCHNAAELHQTRANIPEAIDFCQKAILIRERLARGNPDTPKYRKDLVGSYVLLGQTYHDGGDQKAATASCAKALELVQAVPEEERLSEEYGYLGRAFYFFGRWQEARQALEQEIEDRGDEAPTLEDGPRWWYLTMTLHRLGEVQQARTYYDQLVKEFEERPIAAQASVRAETAKVLGMEKPADKEREGPAVKGQLLQKSKKPASD